MNQSNTPEGKERELLTGQQEQKPLRERSVRFHSIAFDWYEETVALHVMQGTQSDGGYEEKVKLTFERFRELVDLSKLEKALTK